MAVFCPPILSQNDVFNRHQMRDRESKKYTSTWWPFKFYNWNEHGSNGLNNWPCLMLFEWYVTLCMSKFDATWCKSHHLNSSNVTCALLVVVILDNGWLQVEQALYFRVHFSLRWWIIHLQTCEYIILVLLCTFLWSIIHCTKCFGWIWDAENIAEQDWHPPDMCTHTKQKIL